MATSAHGNAARETAWSTRAAGVGAGLAALATLALHLASTPWHFVYDDGAIALRYAVRIAAGDGFSYGGGEPVHGASPVLTVVTSAGLHALGLDLATVVRAIAGAALSAAAGGLAWVTLRRFGPGTCLFGLAALLGTGYHASVLHSGLEAPLLLALMVALWAVLDRPRPALHGVVLGLLVLNKVDAGLVAIVYAVDALARERRFPWRASLVALAVCAPVAVWLLLAFGTVLPHSGVTKVASHVSGAGFDSTWMLALVARSAWLAAPLALLTLLAPSTWRVRRPVAVLGAWALLHLAFFSAVDMGDTFRWYAAQPIFAALLIAVDGVGRLERRLTARGRPLLAAAPALALAVVSLAVEGARELWSGVTRSPHGVDVPPYQHANLGLQAAGAWLRLHTSGTERLAVTHGFGALEYGGPVLDLTGLNSSAEDIATLPHAYSLTVLDPALVAAAGTRRVPGYVTVASFRFGPRHEAFLVARPDSEVVAQGLFAATWDPSTLAVVGPVPAVVVEPNALRWSGSGRLELALPEPRPTRLALRVADGAPPGARLTVERGGAALASAGAGEALDLALGADGAATLTFAVAGLGPGEGLEAVDLVLRTGAPIRASDLRLTSPRQAARVEAWAARGLAGRR